MMLLLLGYFLPMLLCYVSGKLLTYKEGFTVWDEKFRADDGFKFFTLFPVLNIVLLFLHVTFKAQERDLRWNFDKIRTFIYFLPLASLGLLYFL